MRKLPDALLALAPLFIIAKRQAHLPALCGSCWASRGFNRHVENCVFDHRCFLTTTIQSTDNKPAGKLVFIAINLLPRKETCSSCVVVRHVHLACLFGSALFTEELDNWNLTGLKANPFVPDFGLVCTYCLSLLFTATLNKNANRMSYSTSGLRSVEVVIGSYVLEKRKCQPAY